MILQFNNITVHNFGSYGHAEVDLRNRGFCLVSGRNNYVKDNALSNGSGKSFLWNAICYTITGETINGLKSNLKNINIDEDLCYTKLDFNVKEDHYILTRYISPKSDLKIIKNDEDISGKGIRESEKRLTELLPDLTKDLIAAIEIIGQGMPHKLSAFSPSGRKELLEKLTKSDFMIDDIKKRLAERMVIVQSSLRDIEDSLLVLNTQLTPLIVDYEEKSGQVANFSTPDYEAELKKINELLASKTIELNTVTNTIGQFETELERQNNEFLAITAQKNKVASEEFANYEKAKTALVTNKATVVADIRNLTAEIAKLKNIKDTCPTCGQRLPGITRPSTAKEEQALAELYKSQTEVEDSIKACDNQHAIYVNQINAAFDSDIADVKNKLQNVKIELAGQRSNQTNLIKAINVINTDLAKLENDKNNLAAAFANLKNKVAELEATINKIKADISVQIAAKTSILRHVNILKQIDTLVKRDFRGYLLSTIVNYLDSRAKEYSNIVFGTKELNVYLDGNALDISYCGKMFDNLSGGEKQRIDLILQFAIRDLLSKSYNTESNILVLDEVTDYLDKQSCAAVMKLINQELNSTESVFIISHHADELEIPVDSEIKIIKNENGISEVY